MRIFAAIGPITIYVFATGGVSAEAAPNTPTPTSDTPIAASASPESKSTQGNVETGAQAGVRVYVDPETGRRISHPTAEQRAAAAARDKDNPAFSNSSEGLREERLPGGGVLVHLDGRFQSAVTVRRNADGSLVQTCNNPIHASLGEGHAHATPVVVPRDER